MKKCLYPGSFDPFTKGHEDIVNKSLEIFDQVIIGIGINTKKKTLFSIESRINHIKSLFKSGVEILSYDSLTVDFCVKNECSHIIRGIRDTKDFEYEKSIAYMNNELSKIDTVFLLSDQKYLHINSSIVRELYINGADISKFVTNCNMLN